MPRSLIGPLSASVRRDDDLPWSAALGLLVAALLVNGVGVYGTATALSRSLEHEVEPKPEQVMNFDLVEPDAQPYANQHESNDHVPDDAKHLAELDNTAERETKAPPGRDAVNSQQHKPGPQQDDSETADGRGDSQQGERGEADGEGVGEQPGNGDDTLAEAYDGATASAGADAGARRGQPDPLARLGGSPSVLDQTFGRPGLPDQMRDVDEGVTNVLQSKRHLYASFFNRVRDQVADQWRPEQVHRAADPSGSRYGDKTRVTVLMVRVEESSGKLLDIVIEQKSGAPHLDDEAVRAMRAAAPFPNIPGGLANARGHVEFRFGFILDFNGGSRIFRYSD